MRMAPSQETLFSLELVVEKLYVPYVTCRFPAVAFRLLDFPTILISHVEPDLASGIKSKIERDPYYQVPNQFAELQDKHGNFMMKKGKSCLFKIPIATLAMHLSNTPMYIMVIDEFPEVPKLLGNSSLALNEVMDSIKVDIRQNGQTVPSAHGDKGLFKIYSLMGKEIGYIILGFRLLSLGPGLIAHLPEKSIAKRASEVKLSEPKNVIDEIIEVKKQAQVQSSTRQTGPVSQRHQTIKPHEFDFNNTRDMASMTEAEKIDALIQTVELEDDQLIQKAKKELRSMQTQTNARRTQKIIEPVKNLKFANDSEDENEDGVFLKPDIFCPPPMYFNSEAGPPIHIERDDYIYHNYETFEELSTGNMSDDETRVHEKTEIERKQIEKSLNNEKKTVIEPTVAENKNDKQQMQNFNLAQIDPNAPVFPILTALLAEISKIQNPQFLNQAMNQVQHSSAGVDKGTIPRPKDISEKIAKTNADVTELAERSERSANTSARKKYRRSHKASSGGEAGPKQKGWIRKAPEVGVKKTKLVFGLTNTQRLRLAKQNPTWLKSAENDVNVAKALKQKSSTKTKEFDHEQDTGNLSDTYTEVRRLAAAELEKTTMGQTSLREEMEKVKRPKKKPTKSRENSPAKGKGGRTRSKSPKHQPKSCKQEKEIDHDGKDEKESPGITREAFDNVQDSAPSSRIEVHIPSAPTEESDNEETVSFTDTFEEDAGSDRKSKFPGFNNGDETLPEPIVREGTGSMNSTLNTTADIDDNSPMESTRVSKQFRTVPVTDSLVKSTDDYDTKQFHSTDEPELQQLISDEEKSETMYTPSFDPPVRTKTPTMSTAGKGTASTRLSMKFEVLNPTASKNSPLPAMRRSQIKVDSVNARPSPTDTPRSRSSQSSPRGPTPRQRKSLPLRERKIDFKKESIHTESVSSYMPSESENILSLISDGSYSDDFHVSSDKDASRSSPAPEFPKLIPSTKLGFTIG